MADTATNLVRSILGQGLAMGWGDEAEAWLRSKLGDEEYEKALTEIRSEYGTFSEESPVLSGVGEIAGGAIPAVASFLTPGGQLSAATTTGRMLGPLSRLIGLGKTAGQRTTAQNVGRIATTGGVQGAVTGAGSTEGDRTEGAVGGGLLGTAFGVATPLVLKGTGELASRTFDMAGVSPDKAKQWALEKLNLALDDESPTAIASRIRQDIQLGVPPAIANVTPGTVQLAESVVQRGGEPSRELEKVIAQQKAGARDRVAKQVRRGLRARDYYGEESRLMEDLRSDADTMYDAAYAVGDIDDPKINMVLQEPEFQEFFKRAQEILRLKRSRANLEPGGDPSKFALKQIYDPQTGQMTAIPDVRTLDYIKQGMDAEIAATFTKDPTKAYALKDLRNTFVNRIDELVPEYRAARAEYKGDIETLEALRLGRDEFRNLDPEQVQELVKKMSKGELNAFRTGVARNLYDSVMDPATDINAAKKIIGSPSTRKSLEAIFETPAQRDFFMTALERELELFKAAGQILAGSPTAKRTAMRESLENRPGVVEAAAETASRGTIGMIADGVLSLMRKGVPDEYYEELANLLKSGSPKEVAAVVKMLEEAAKKRGIREGKVGGTQAGIVGGTIGLAPPAPESAEARRSREERQMLYR